MGRYEKGTHLVTFLSGIRISNFGLLSAFGFRLRTSDLGLWTLNFELPPAHLGLANLDVHAKVSFR